MGNLFKKGLDRQSWIQTYPTPNAHAAGGSLAGDLRNDASRNPFVYQLASVAILNRYHIFQKAWNFVQSPALGGTFGAGAGAVFAPSCGLMGTIAAGATTTSVVLSTALPAAVGTNMLANRGGGVYGYKIRIKGNSAGGSGKIEERWIIGNTLGTTPIIYVDAAFTFTPASGDGYEILSGKLFMLSAGTMASGTWRSFETASNYLATALSITNLPATVSTDCAMIALDEQYVPYDHKPGEGFVIGAGTYDASNSKYCLTATAIAAGTITGQASAGDASVLANEYRNFQIRIVEDTAIPTAVGQRRMIASHTGGASPVYTLGTAWTVNPSATAKFVIEYPNLLFLRSTATTTVYTYNYSGATINNGTNSITNDAWSVTYFGAAANAMGAGCVLLASFGHEPETSKTSRHSYIYCFRGGAINTLDLFDIAGGTTGLWTAGIVYDGATVVGTGACGKYAPAADEGRYGYLNIYTASAINQMFRFDVKNRVLTPITPTKWVQAGTAAVGDRVATFVAIDGTDKYTDVLLLSHLGANAFELVVMQ
jgi:hypothetical protein